MTDPGPAQAAGIKVRGLTDVRSVREILWPAFLEGERERWALDYRQEVDMPRLRRETGAQSPGERPDVLLVADPLLFARLGVVAPVDATAEGPRPAAWVDRENRWVSVYVQPIVAIHNAIYSQPPRSWLELAATPWHGRLVVEAPARMLTTGPALAELAAALGPDVWLPWLHDLAAGGLRQVADNERAVLEVATGARWAGLANWNVARRVRPGSPVRHVFLDPTPCVPAFAVAVDGGTAPELGHRFVRWLASAAGQAAVRRTGRLPAADIEVPPAETAPVIPPGVRTAVGTADWVAEPDHWVGVFTSTFGAETDLQAGKLRD
ncbi:MAG TPA: substrate-binding domain-containing protein [Candidatus Limnocylindrales bacterium]